MKIHSASSTVQLHQKTLRRNINKLLYKSFEDFLTNRFINLLIDEGSRKVLERRDETFIRQLPHVSSLKPLKCVKLRNLWHRQELRNNLITSQFKLCSFIQASPNNHTPISGSMLLFLSITFTSQVTTQNVECFPSLASNVASSSLCLACVALYRKRKSEKRFI